MRLVSLFLTLSSVYSSYIDDIPDFPEDTSAASGRVVMSWKPSQIEKLDSRMAAFLVYRLKRDEDFDEYTPQFTRGHMHETAPQFGRLELDELIYTSDRVVTFSVKNNSDILVRYVHDCNGMSSSIFPHPLLSETFLAAKAAMVDVAPRVYFVSPPARYILNRESSPKVAFKMDPIQHMECALGDTTVRFSITERIHGRPLMGFLLGEKLKGVVHAARLAHSILPLLEKLHSQNIVHGDLGPDRITLSQIDDEYRFHFVNFAHSSFTDADGFATMPVYQSRRRTFMKSPWEQDGRYSKKDDLFRLIQIVAAVINPTEYIQNQVELMISGNVTSLMAWKRHGNIFTPPPLNQSSFAAYSSGLGDLADQLIRYKLLEIETLVRNSPTQVPSRTYALITEKFRAIVIIAIDAGMEVPGLVRRTIVQSTTTTGMPTTDASHRKKQRYI